jgi:glycosyltransferase involved in cell wall biosynthesis
LKRVSIIIPVYNAANTISDCVASLLAQATKTDFEIIFVDNNSTDRGLDKIPRDARVQVLHEPRQGAYAARNTGVQAAKGDFLLFTDPDCIADPGWIEAHVRVLENPRTPVSLGRVLHGGDRKIMRLLSEYDRARQAIVFRSRISEHYFGYTNNLGITARAWERIGPFETRQRGADTVLIQRAVQQYGPAAVRYIPRASVRHLEVDTVSAYWKKMLIYGRSARLFRRLATPSPPDWKTKFRSYRLAIDHAEAGGFGHVQLLGALAVGVLSHGLGYRLGFGILKEDAQPAKTRTSP